MGVCDVPVISTVCDKVGEGAASLITAPFNWLADSLGAAAGWLFKAVWDVFDTTTAVDVQTEAYISVYNLLFGIAAMLMLVFFCLQLITGMIRREPGALSRAALGLGKSVLGSFVVITLTALALQIVDELCKGIIQAAGETTETMGDKIAGLVAGLTGLNLVSPGVGAILTIFLASLAIAAAAIVWISLLVRKALLLIAIVLAPIAFSGASWDASRGWISKWASLVIALIASKLVLVVILLVAVTQVAAPIDGDLGSIGDPLAGVVLMGMAGFAPYITYRFLSFVGFDLYNVMGSEQEAKQALNRPVPMPGKPGGQGPKKVLDEGGGKDDGSGQSSGKPGGGGESKPPTSPSAGAGPEKAAAPSAGGGTAGATGEAGAAGGSGAAAGGGAAAAGPAIAVVAGAKAVKGAAEAGPASGKAVAGQAEEGAAAADSSSNSGRQSSGSSPTPPSSTPPPPSAPTPGPPTTPQPTAPQPQQSAPEAPKPSEPSQPSGKE